MTQDMTTQPAIEPAISLSPGRSEDEPLQSYLAFEVHVAAGQAWLAMPGHADCRAMYPDRARSLANVLERVAGEGGAHRVHLAQDVSFVIGRQGDDVVLIREDMTDRPDVHHAFETAADALRLARRIRAAADRAEGASALVTAA